MYLEDRQKMWCRMSSGLTSLAYWWFHGYTCGLWPKTARKGKNAQEQPHPGPSHNKIGWFNHQRAMCSRPCNIWSPCYSLWFTATETSVYKENSQISEDTAHWHQPFHWGHPGLNTLQTGTLRLEHLCCSLRQRPSVTVGKTRPLDNKTCYDLPFSPMLYTGSEGRENKETTLGEEMACHGSTGSSW